MLGVDDGPPAVATPVAPAGAPAPAPTPGPEEPDGTFGAGGLAERCVWSLVWLGVIAGGFQLWGSFNSWSFGGIAAPLLVLAGIVGLAATWLVPSSRSSALQLWAFGMTVATTLANEGIGIHTRRFYSTDSAAFDQVAGKLLQHGTDPYAVPLNAAAGLLKTPSQYWTYLMDGGHVDHFSYPAGSILLQLPALALGFHHEVVDWFDLFAWIATAVLLFALLPASVRWLAALLLLAPAFSAVFGSGGTDAAFLPFLVLAVWRWDRFGLGRTAGVARWMGPVALGLACAIKQTPWFCLPFIAVGLAIEARASGRDPWRLVGRYVAIVAGIFAVVNLPFVIWQPTDWARGTFLPFVSPLVPNGQGLVTLALHGIVHGVSLPLLSLAGLLLVVALLAALAIWYPRMKRVWMLLLPLAFFVATRSLSTYLADLYPAAIVAAISVGAAPRRSPAPATAGAGRRRWPLGWAVVVPALAAVGVSVLAFASPPLQLGVRSVTTSNAAQKLDAVTLDVHNATDQSVIPHFMVNVGGGDSDGFWVPGHGQQQVLGPHASETVTIDAPGYFWAPGHGSQWLVEAYTSSPEALSTTPLMYWPLGQSH